MFPDVSSDVKFPALEEEVLHWWRAHRIYDKSLDKRRDGPRFVFYEGPPTANGMPHPGHCLTRAIKDLFPRYRTMRGYLCERKAGWDTHGLPVEVEVCKELGIHSKEEIEQYGVEPFIHECQKSVWRYMQEWEQLTERLGFWIKLDEAYVTYHQSYVESVWWSLKQLFDRGLLYQGHKIVWWWAQGGTALSSGEVGQGYREVADPSVFVRFPLVDQPDRALLVWTTTPWTLPANQFVAVHPELTYAVVRDVEGGEELVVAADLVDALAAKVKTTFEIVESMPGSELVGKRYGPPFDFYYAQDGERTGRLREGGTDHIAWRVVAADFVTVESGTGLVHQAPAFGEVDYEVLLAEQRRFADGEGPPLLCPVAPDGKFTGAVPDWEGTWVKDADKPIIRTLRERGLLWHQEQYVHDYPFCWRAEDDPLIQYPRKSWFIRTTQFKDRMLENNRHINWLPEHIRDGRFGNFLESNVDWALSRERFWGTPLPIWVCEETGRMEAVGSYRELLEKPGVAGIDVWNRARQTHPDLPEDLKVHKPYIDAVTYDSPFAPQARMRRVDEVIDCWYDSGAMPFAQWGYPHQGRDRFVEQFPADFISEAIDQTRGWFYSLLAISTMLFGPGEDEDRPAESPCHDWPHPYRTCIVLGLMLGEDGNKMSKSRRNYREPREILDRYGADALRWYFYANQTPWTSIRYREQSIRESIPEFILRLWNVFSFLVTYANIDRFDPAQRLPGDVGELRPIELGRGEGYRDVSQRSEIDRWILSELHRTTRSVIERMDAYDNYTACRHLHRFVDLLSNWYVRRSRARFWSADTARTDKIDAYWTLYEVLLTTAKLIAPFTPFLAESLWRRLTGIFGDRATESVHLCDFPEASDEQIDESLLERMELLREIASLGRAARMNAKQKVRQPLARVEVVLGDTRHQPWLETHDALLREELNVKRVEYTTEGADFIDYQIVPNFKRLGPRLGPRMPKVKQLLAQASAEQLMRELHTHHQVTLDVDGTPVVLDADDLEVRLQAKPGWAAAQGRNTVVVLNTELTPELIREGYARDLVRHIQERRKSLQCQYTDRIRIGIVTASDDVRRAIEEHGEYVQRETLALSLDQSPRPGVEPVTARIGPDDVAIYVEVAAEHADASP